MDGWSRMTGSRDKNTSSQEHEAEADLGCGEHKTKAGHMYMTQEETSELAEPDTSMWK